jgi:hypothetical protein
MLCPCCEGSSIPPTEEAGCIACNEGACRPDIHEAERLWDETEVKCSACGCTYATTLTDSFSPEDLFSIITVTWLCDDLELSCNCKDHNKET